MTDPFRAHRQFERAMQLNREGRLVLDPANTLTRNEVEILRFVLDDADMLNSLPRDHEKAMHALWRRLHLWHMATAGDDDAAMMLAREFPNFRAIDSARAAIPPQEKR